jgi:uncharacterized membrane protein
MIVAFLSWWGLSAVLGLLAIPLASRFLGRLPDRGLGLARALGILLAGFVLWSGATLGFLRNDLGGALGAVLLLAVASTLALRSHARDLASWLRVHWRVAIWTEVVFLAAFGLWTVVRAHNPEIVATEKPMELAFLNAILRSPTFPPGDPWLSGYAISYYYFGYVMLAMLARLSGISAGVAFNLGNALWFGLTAVGAYSLLFNLLSWRDGKPQPMLALLGPLFVLLAGNLEGFLDVLWSLHLGWQTGAGGQLVSGFWNWLDIKQINEAPTSLPTWLPDRYLWWWRASRVVNDLTLSGSQVEVIDEFPFFSFLLADNHPHLLSLPFALTSVGFSLHIFLGGLRNGVRYAGWLPSAEFLRRLAWAGGALVLLLAGGSAARAIAGGMAGPEVLQAGLRTGILLAGLLILLASLAAALSGAGTVLLTRAEFWAAALLFGGLAFLNTWDLPIYLCLLLFVLGWQARGLGGQNWLRTMGLTALALTTAAVLLYLPWYPTFTSQASGLLPNLGFPTRFPQFLVMFGTAFFPLLAWLGWRGGSRLHRREGKALLGLGLGLPIALLLLSWILGGVVWLADPASSQISLNEFGATSLGIAFRAILLRRLLTAPTSLALGALLGLCAVVLLRESAAKPAKPSPNVFVVGMTVIGVLLVLGPEFVYLHDLFGSRMNTVFKFYFAAWILLGLAAAYAATELWPRRLNAVGALRLLMLVPLVLGLVYPLLATWTKTSGFSPTQGATLDGIAHLEPENPADYAAIRWIQQNLPGGVVAEAVGGSYTEFARISAHTGLSTVLGWDFHEVQWRNGMEGQGSRRDDIRTLYETREAEQAEAILDRYGIDYVYVGPLERRTYQPLVEQKFAAILIPVYSQGDVTIYARKPLGGVP